MNFKTRIFFIATVVLLIVGAVIFFIYNHNPYPPAIPLLTAEQPTVGNPAALASVVVFEDPRCTSCVSFHKEYFDLIRKKYIDKGKVAYTVFLVSEKDPNALISRILFCINEQSTDSFFEVLDEYYNHLPSAQSDVELEKTMVQIIQDLSLPIDYGSFHSCIKTNRYYQKAVENTEYARAIMGGRIRTPTVFVNGIRLVRPDIKEVVKLINKELR